MLVEDGKPYSLLPVNLLYLMMGIVFIFLGSILQHWNFNIGILATEYGMLVLPASLFMYAKKHSIKKAFRFTKPKLGELGLVLAAGICFVPVVAFLNSLINVWLVYGLRITPPQIPVGSGPFAPVITFLIAAVTPGLCEEFFFRGMILSEYERRMIPFQAAVVTAFMFGLFHYNVMNLFGPIALGLIFAWTLQVTGCFWNAMLGHLVNNSLAVIMIYATSGVSREVSQNSIEALGNYWPITAALTLVFLAGVAAICGVGGVYLLKMIRKRHPKCGDHIEIQNRVFQVVEVNSDSLTIQELTNEDTLEVVETTWQKVFANKGAKYAHAHWKMTFDLSIFRLREWWPIGMSMLLYIGVNVLSIKMLIPD